MVMELVKHFLNGLFLDSHCLILFDIVCLFVCLFVCGLASSSLGHVSEKNSPRKGDLPSEDCAICDAMASSAVDA